MRWGERNQRRVWKSINEAEKSVNYNPSVISQCDVGTCPRIRLPAQQISAEIIAVENLDPSSSRRIDSLSLTHLIIRFNDIETKGLKIVCLNFGRINSAIKAEKIAFFLDRREPPAIPKHPSSAWEGKRKTRASPKGIFYIRFRSFRFTQ